MKNGLLEKRFWDKVKKTDLCWLWTAYKDKRGYGGFLIKKNVSVKAHRMSYELSIGPVPEGMVIDHLCQNKSCVNPTHLEPVSSRTNSLRAKNTLAFINADKKHCPKGHPLCGDNLMISKNGYNGARRCKKCKNEQERKRYNSNRVIHFKIDNKIIPFKVIS